MCREMNQSQYDHQYNHQEKSNRQEISDFSLEIHVLAGTLVLLCRPTLGDSATKRCCTNLVHTIGHRKNLPTSEVTQ
jgi:hypothetical protein